MTKRFPKDMTASIRNRLLTIHRETGEEFNHLLVRYAMERILYRLGRSSHSKAFVLKGAMLFMAWTSKMHRPTKDIDFLGFGDLTDERLRIMVEEICATEVDPDGLSFDTSAMEIEEIREEQEYQGRRIRFMGSLGKALIRLQIDVGFGDVVSPKVETINFPSLLGLPPPRIRAYPKETVVAEKLEAMVDLGMDNSRMKDFYDLWILSHTFSFEGPLLCRAIKATFQRRNTELPPEIPFFLTKEFYENAKKKIQWKAFLTKSVPEESKLILAEVIGAIRDFMLEPFETIASGAELVKTWGAGGPWSK